MKTVYHQNHYDRRATEVVHNVHQVLLEDPKYVVIFATETTITIPHDRLIAIVEPKETQ